MTDEEMKRSYEHYKQCTYYRSNMFAGKSITQDEQKVFKLHFSSAYSIF